MDNGKKVGRPPGKRYPERLMVYLDERRFAVLAERAERQGTSMAELVRRALDAAAKRERVT